MAFLGGSKCCNGIPGGSSPPARGSPVGAALAATNCRFIPACAGNTCRGAAGTSSHPVHPRLRGEHAQCREVQQARGGSSPPARGTREQQTESRGIRRFIPACAGNTPSHFTLRTSPPVHPRLRGEHEVFRAEPTLGGGSSPPARGTRT